MFPKTHMVIGAIVSILVYLIFQITSFEAFLIFFASVFIDFDHYLWYALKYKDWNLKNAYYSFKEKRKAFHKLPKHEKHKHKMPYLIFHVAEFWIILFLFSYLNKLAFFLLLGIAIHMALDYIEIIHHKSIFYPKFSLVLTYFKNRKKEKHYF